MSDLSALPDAPDVAVVIPARDAEETLRAAVEAVLRQPHPAGLEVVIAVGPSQDRTAEVAGEVARAYADVAVVENPAGRTPTALNLAIAATTAPVIVRVDAHSLLPNGYIQQAIEILRVTGAANVGGRQVPRADAGFARAVAAAMRSPVGSGGAAYRAGAEPGPADTVYLGVFRRDALQAVGGFDETMIRNQDYELNVRLRDAGFEVWFDPGLEVDYRPRGSIGALARQYWEYARWRRETLARHPQSLRTRQLAAPALVAGLGMGVLFSVFGFWWPIAVVGGAEILVVGAGALAAGRPLVDVPLRAVALLTMHLSWGSGFLMGRPSTADSVR